MNKVYKSIWNCVTQSWTAVSEVTSSRKKSHKVAAVVGAIVVSMLPLSEAASASKNWYGVGFGSNGAPYAPNNRLYESGYNGGSTINAWEHINYEDSFTIGGKSPIISLDDALNLVSVNSNRNFVHYIRLTSNNGTSPKFIYNVDGDADTQYSLFEQSQGFDQFLMAAPNITFDKTYGDQWANAGDYLGDVEGEAAFTLRTDDVNRSSAVYHFSQTIYQKKGDGEAVATGYYRSATPNVYSNSNYGSGSKQREALVFCDDKGNFYIQNLKLTLIDIHDGKTLTLTSSDTSTGNEDQMSATIEGDKGHLQLLASPDSFSTQEIVELRSVWSKYGYTDIGKNVNVVVNPSTASDSGERVLGFSYVTFQGDNSALTIPEGKQTSVSGMQMHVGSSLNIGENGLLTLLSEESLLSKGKKLPEEKDFGHSYFDGTVYAGQGSTIKVEKGITAHISETSKLANMKGTWNLQDTGAETYEGATFLATIKEGAENEIPVGRIIGGNFVKRGAGSLDVAYDVINKKETDPLASAVDVTVEQGTLSVTGWQGKLNLASLTIGNVGNEASFNLAGDLTLVGNDTEVDDGFFLAGADSKIYLNQVGATNFVTRTIDGDFTSNGSVLHFNTRLGTDASEGDQLIIIGDATGVTTLAIHDAGEVKANYDDLTLITVNGSVDGFAPVVNFEANGYSYQLEHRIEGQESVIVDASNDVKATLSVDTASVTSSDSETETLTEEATPTHTYVLSHYLPVTEPDPNPDPDSNPGSDTPRVPMYSPRLGALSGFAASADMFQFSVHDRQGTRPWINPLTGEREWTSMWIRQTFSRNETDDSTGQLSSKDNRHVTMIGGDLVQHTAPRNGFAYAGLMAGYGNSDYKTESDITGRHSRADTDGWMVGFYAGWHQNDPQVDRTGLYVDGWLQYANFKSDITSSGDKLTARADGLSVSLEAGYIGKIADFTMNEGRTKGSVYLEPRAQAVLWGTEYDTLDDNMELHGKGNVTTWLGARLTVEASGETHFSPYVEANWVHNTRRYGATWGDVTSYVEGTKNQAELKAGVESFFTDNLSGYAQLRLNWGSDGYNHREGSVGVRYQF